METPRPTLELISRIIADIKDIESSSVSADLNLLEDLDVDDMDLMEIACEIEEEFMIDVDPDEVEKCDTVNDVVNLSQKKWDDRSS